MGLKEASLKVKRMSFDGDLGSRVEKNSDKLVVCSGPEFFFLLLDLSFLGHNSGESRFIFSSRLKVESFQAW